MDPNKVKNFFLLLLAFCAVCTSTYAQGLSQSVHIDSLKVGDTFTFSLIIDRDKEYDEVALPDSSDLGAVFEIRSRKRFKLSAYKDSVSYQLQFFGTADTVLPQLPVYLVQAQDTTVLYTNPVPVKFSSILAQNDEVFRPLKPIFEFSTQWWPYILGLLVLAGLAYYLYKYYTNNYVPKEPQEQKTFVPVPFVNPLKELQENINELEEAELNSRDNFKEFYIKLGDAIRQYYESLYNLPALESTSRELLVMLNNGRIDKNLIEDTRLVLQEADMVKFANFTPSTDQAEHALSKAYDFLKRAREVDGPRIEHLRRKHLTKTEAERQRFYADQRKEVQA